MLVLLNSRLLNDAENIDNIENKKLSKVVPKEFYTQLDLAIFHENQLQECFKNVIKIGEEAGLTNYETALLIRQYCKGKIGKTTIWKYTKAIQDKELAEIEQSTSQSVRARTDRIEESSSYPDDDIYQQIEAADQGPETVVFSFENVSINLIQQFIEYKIEESGNKTKTLKKLYFEIDIKDEL